MTAAYRSKVTARSRSFSAMVAFSGQRTLVERATYVARSSDSRYLSLAVWNSLAVSKSSITRKATIRIPALPTSAICHHARDAAAWMSC